VGQTAGHERFDADRGDATLLDLNFPSAAIKTVPLLARTASILAHLMEEKARPIGFHMAAAAEKSVAFEKKR
jgi:citrate synthase